MNGAKDAGVILLTDIEEHSQISFLCDNTTQRQFEQRFESPNQSVKYLPEALSQILKSHPGVSLSMHIVDIRNGQYVVFLTEENLPLSVMIRASDAALLSFVSDIPLYINTQLFRVQSTPYEEGSSMISIPINIMTDNMLQKALDEAVKRENYELASHIKTEQQRRTNNAKKE